MLPEGFMAHLREAGKLGEGRVGEVSFMVESFLLPATSFRRQDEVVAPHGQALPVSPVQVRCACGFPPTNGFS